MRELHAFTEGLNASCVWGGARKERAACVCAHGERVVRVYTEGQLRVCARTERCERTERVNLIMIGNGIEDCRELQWGNPD